MTSCGCAKIRHPSTGEKLTQRLNTTRTEDGENAANRRIFYDFTFSPPKSVSLAGFLGKDERILEAHARAVRSALREFEAFAATRIRIGGAQNDRLTGNFVATLFTHDTSRALDPHLHTHCIVFNATFDPVENRWKALQNYELLRASKFAENVYYHELARELRGFGYQIRNRAARRFPNRGHSRRIMRTVFQTATHRLIRRWRNCWRTNQNLTGGKFKNYGPTGDGRAGTQTEDLSRDELRTPCGMRN